MRYRLPKKYIKTKTQTKKPPRNQARCRNESKLFWFQPKSDPRPWIRGFVSLLIPPAPKTLHRMQFQIWLPKLPWFKSGWRWTTPHQRNLVQKGTAKTKQHMHVHKQSPHAIPFILPTAGQTQQQWPLSRLPLLSRLKQCFPTRSA